MALIFLGKTTCSICGEILQESDATLGTPAFIAPSWPLYEYSDSGMHKRCFATWEHREEFRALFNQSWPSEPAQLGHRSYMQLDGEIVLIRGGKIVSPEEIMKETLALIAKERAESDGES